MKKLGDLLLEKNVVTKDDLDKALKIQAGGSRRLGEILVSLNLVSEERLVDILSEQPGVARRTILGSKCSKLLPKYICKKYSIYGISVKDNVLDLAMLNPTDIEAITKVEYETGTTVNPILVKRSEIIDCINSVPFSMKDIINTDNINRISKYLLVVLAITSMILLGLVSKIQYHRVNGTEIQIESGNIYENLDLTIQVTDDNKVKFQGHGAYSKGIFSVDLVGMNNLKVFVDSKRDSFSKEQLEWMETIINNK